MTHHTALHVTLQITQHKITRGTTLQPHYILHVLRALHTPCRVTCTRAAQRSTRRVTQTPDLASSSFMDDWSALRSSWFCSPAETEVRIVEQIVESSVSQVAAGPLFGLLSRVRILSHVTRQAHISNLFATPFSVSYQHNRYGDCSRRQIK